MSTLVLADGTLFAGRYRVVRCIAQGGMGAVYEVLHVETERRRALKVMLPHLVARDELRQRFRQEARVAAKVESAFIVDVFDAGIDDETRLPFLVMELLRGEEIGKRLARFGRFSFQDTVGFLWQTALALDKTHAARIVHRDLKPENLFLAEQDDGPPRIKVLDFGIAKLVAEQGTAANATQSIGTPMYMAPEQFLTDGKVSPATDIFSLGMMAYTLMVGMPYWQDEKDGQLSVYSFLAAVMRGPREAASVRAARRGVELPAAFDVWFAQATAVEPRDRFGSATEAMSSLNIWGFGSPSASFAPNPSLNIWGFGSPSASFAPNPNLVRALSVSIPASAGGGQMTASVGDVLPTVAVSRARTSVSVGPNMQATGFGLSSSHAGQVLGEVAGRDKPKRPRMLAIAGVAGVCVVGAGAWVIVKAVSDAPEPVVSPATPSSIASAVPLVEPDVLPTSSVADPPLIASAVPTTQQTSPSPKKTVTSVRPGPRSTVKGHSMQTSIPSNSTGLGGRRVL